MLVEEVPDEAGLAPLATRLVATLPRPAFLAISGDLGAGKTTFVKSVAAACGLDPADVISPTFGLIHVFELPSRPGLPRRLIHADLYRLGGVADLAETAGRTPQPATPGYLSNGPNGLLPPCQPSESMS